MARKASADRRYLELHGGKWRVTVPVPRDLQRKLGSTKLKRALGTDSLAVANILKPSVVAELRGHIHKARHGDGADPLRLEALAIAEARARAKTEPEREMIAEAARVHAEELLGNPIRSGPDFAGQQSAEYDAERERRADAYAGIALGTATPLDLYHGDFVLQSHTKARTKGDDRRAIKYLLEWCAKRELNATLQAFTQRVAVQFMDEIREVAGEQRPITLNKYLGRLSGYWQWLLKRGHVEANPWAGLRVSAPKANYEEEERPFTDVEVATLLSGPAPQRMQDLMRIAALTGARLDAIVDLRVKDCAGGSFLFKPQKGETKPRPVPIHSALASIVARRTAGKAGDDDDSLFPEWPAPRKEGSQRERSFKASNAFTKYRREVGVELMVEGKRRSLINFHSFRRWFITKAEQAGQPENIIAAVVGHKRPGMTFGRYSAGPDVEQARRCVEAVRLPA